MFFGWGERGGGGLMGSGWVCRGGLVLRPSFYVEDPIGLDLE